LTPPPEAVGLGWVSDKTDSMSPSARVSSNFVTRGTLWQVSQHRCHPIKLGCASISDCHSGLIYCARLIWLQELVIIYTCQRTCTQAKLVRGLDPHGSNALPPKDLILLMTSNGYPTF
jgi:hypothetical protein